MLRSSLIFLLLWLAAPAPAQTPGLEAPAPTAASLPSPAEDLLDSVEVWMQDHLDEDLFDSLGEVDGPRLRQFLREVRKRFAATAIYDLGELAEAAQEWAKFLKEYEETQTYGDWLQAHLDYFDVANQLKQRMTPPDAKPGQAAPPPSLEIQRSVWAKQLASRPLPLKAEDFASRLKPIFAAEKMPTELVWIAEVESSFNPAARSPAGAVGLFQLMPDTARRLGLATSPEDERLQPEKSAQAAAKHLRALHERLGDWRLALAAYNAGEARVDKLLKRSRNRTFDDIASRLPAETQMYIPKIEATLRKREDRALTDLKVAREPSIISSEQK